jgi:hypothetical protein
LANKQSIRKKKIRKSKPYQGRWWPICCWVDECGGFGWMEADLLLEEKSRQSERERYILRDGERERERKRRDTYRNRRRKWPDFYRSERERERERDRERFKWRGKR